MARDLTIDSILAGRTLEMRYRILSCDLAWPTPYAEPPFSAGERVSVPAVATDPPAYSRESFDASVWTDVTALTSSYHFNDALDQQCGALTLTVPAEWDDADLDRAFRAMRAILVQERYTGAGQDTGWTNVAWCLSSGYSAEWDPTRGAQLLTINGLTALALANLDPIASEDGSALYQADLVQVGQYTDHEPLPLVRQDLSDAWEYGVTDWPGGPHANPRTTAISSSRLIDSNAAFTAALVGKTVTAVKFSGNETATILAVESSTQLRIDSHMFSATGTPYYIGGIQPNWSDRPGPQLWLHNVPDADQEVPLSLGGAAVTVMHGEGTIRVGKTWARTDPGDPEDFSVGLGYAVDEIPEVRGVLFRFAHPEDYSDRDGLDLPTDLADSLEQIEDPPTAGQVIVSGDITDLPAGLTLLLDDGSGTRLATESLTLSGSDTIIGLVDPTASVAAGTALRYGDANRAVDTVRRWLVECGFHTDSSDLALYAAVPDSPELNGETLPIILPPMRYEDLDRTTRMQAIASLRSSYAVLPNWQTRADEYGRILTQNITQLFDDATGPNAQIIPLQHAEVLRARVDKTDINVYTRTVARGRVRLVDDVTDLGLHPTLTIADVTEANGGLPTVNGSREVTIDAVTYTLTGTALRSGGSGQDYVLTLEQMLSRDQPVTTRGEKLRPWGWYYRAAETRTGVDNSQKLRNAWCGKALAEITLEEAASIAAIELHAPNTWWADHTDWGGNRHADDVWIGRPWITGSFELKAHADPQMIRLDYYDDTLAQWRPLTQHIRCGVSAEVFMRIEEDEFATRGRVTTDRLRIVCVEPFFAECGTDDEAYYHTIIGAYLLTLRVYASDEIRGVAEIGVDSPFTGSRWEAARARFRRRTYVVPDVADWATDQTHVDALALDWLYHVTRNLAPRPVVAVRPDVRAGDTVRMPLPTGEVVCYGDTSEQTSRWRLYGITAQHSDDLLLYWSLTDSGGTRTVSLYRDSARTALVAQGSLVGDGEITLSEQNGSRIAGSVTVAYTGNDTGTVAPPTHLVTAVDRGGEGSEPAPQQLTLVNYRDPYFEEE